MRLRDLHRTSGFHIALLFFATFGAASLALFGFLYLETRSYGRASAYEWVRWESARLSRLSPDQLLERTGSWEDFEQGGRPLTVLGADGHRIAGAAIALPPSAPLGHPFELTQTLGGQKHLFYALVTPLPNGERLLVARSAKILKSLETALVDTFVWGIGATIAIGLTGAVAFGLGSLRQIEAITSAAERIMRGDLSERLPRKGLSADLGHLTSVVNDMLEQLQRLMNEVKGVNENIAHDLRTPLTRVMASLERSLRNARTAEDFRAVNEDVVTELRHIVVRFSALLRISELEDRARRAGFGRVDLAKVLTDVFEYYEPIAEQKKVTLVRDEAAVTAEIDGDASLLFEAASNLIDNAIKFTPAGGEVRLAVTAEPSGLVVSDNGWGIPENELTRVKRRFARGDGAHGSAGFGIGLSLVDSIARLHNMDLALAPNAPGCRATLRARTGAAADA